MKSKDYFTKRETLFQITEVEDFDDEVSYVLRLGWSASRIIGAALLAYNEIKPLSDEMFIAARHLSASGTLAPHQSDGLMKEHQDRLLAAMARDREELKNDVRS